MSRDGAGPPKPPLALTVGVTGHRREALPDDMEPLRRDCSDALRLIQDAARAVHDREAQWYSPGNPALTLLSPLAEGADQIVAETALGLGFDLHAVLGFDRQATRASLPENGDRANFDLLLERAVRVLELPGEDGARNNAYVMTARATVAHSDILLAVWDGAPARGRGGTAAVVELAVRRGVAVIHIDPGGRDPPALVWSGFDPAVITEGAGQSVRRPLSRENLIAYFSAIASPPADADERRFLTAFTGERPRRFQGRIEYSLLLALVGAARFRASALDERRGAAATAAEWDDFRSACADPHKVSLFMDVLGSAYTWSDRLATRFSQSYRSGHIFNFVLGGAAVCLGLIGNILPGMLLPFALAEVVVTGLILFNTRVGVRNEWHRRWLDYRQLAERLRPMRSLKLLALASPDPPGSAANPTPRRWMEWYALAIWRALGCPSARIDNQCANDLAKSVAVHELAPQIAYHRSHARQIEMLDHRLERISVALFWVTLVVSGLAVAGAALRPDLLREWDPWLTLAGAGFPAVATAVFGIRFQGDFGGSAVRSENTALALDGLAAELERGRSLDRAADLAEQAGRVMLSDLDQWRLVNQQQDLDLL